MNTSKSSKTVHRFFTAWNEQRETRWLKKMSKEGWHLSQFGFGTYRFVKGTPGDFTYCFDYRVQGGKDFPEYTALFSDGGWEYIDSFANWHCFRTQQTNSQTPDIFSDNRSKMEKFIRLRRTLVLAILPSLLWLTTFFPFFLEQTDHSTLFLLLVGFIAAADAFIAYGIARIQMLIVSLKKHPRE
ncbi:MAG TPA: DUF2812 domain-containing protein [Thermotogota bacterium]|nr:DUF2812 domain-containing protein [Thermotogota bacterium]HRW91488.1 DUF2812 domain-containing protein [Thermotogota bacterium]